MVEIIGESGKNEALIKLTDVDNDGINVQLAFKRPPDIATPGGKGTPAERLALDIMGFIKIRQQPAEDNGKKDKTAG